MAKKEKLSREERVEHYFNVWGSDKRTLVSITRQLIFILGIATSIIIATWVLMNDFLPFVSNNIYKIITRNVSIISIVFMSFVCILDFMYLIAETATMNKNKLNRIPSFIVGYIIGILLIVFIVLTCVEIYGPQQGSRSYLYSIYMVICFSCCIFSTIYCFDEIRKNEKFNPNNKLMKTLSYTIGFVGILAVITFILWIMWYPATGGMSDTCFLLARTSLTLVGDALVKIIAQIFLVIATRKNSEHWRKRLLVFCLLWAVLFAFEMWSGSIFLVSSDIWQTSPTQTKIAMILTILCTIAVSAVNINIASRYQAYLEKK